MYQLIELNQYKFSLIFNLIIHILLSHVEWAAIRPVPFHCSIYLELLISLSDDMKLSESSEIKRELTVPYALIVWNASVLLCLQLHDTCQSRSTIACQVL